MARKARWKMLASSLRGSSVGLSGQSHGGLIALEVLIKYFLKDLPEDAVLTERHRHLLEQRLFRERQLDRFIGNVNLEKFMQSVPKYAKGGLHR